MVLTIKIEQIDFADAALRALPLLEKAVDHDSALGKTAAAVSQLPAELIRSVIDAIPDAQKQEIIAAFVTEYKEKILDAANALSRENRIGVTLADISVSPELQLRAQAGSIDYPTLVDRFLAVIKEKLLGMGGPVTLMRPIIKGASAEQICALMDRFLGSRKEEFLAALVNQNQHTLIAVMEDTAAKQGIRLKVRELDVQA